MAQLYRSQVRPSATAVVAMLSAATGVALLLAFLWDSLGVLGHIIILGGVVRAVIIGKLLAWICHRTFFSWPRSAAIIAAFATLLAIFGALYNGHRLLRNQEIAARDQVLAVSAEPEGLANHYSEKIAAMTFSHYLQSYFGGAAPITSDNADYVDGSAAMFGPRVGIGLFLVELLLALLVAAYYPAGVASEPVCTRCGRWLRETTPVGAAYGITHEFIDTMLQPSPNAAAALLMPPDTKETLVLSMAQCSFCDTADARVLRVRDRFGGNRGKELLERHRCDLQLCGEEVPILMKRMRMLESARG